MSKTQKIEIKDGMCIEWDVPITMEDGLVLRADVFRPIEDGQYPVLLALNPYGNLMAFYDSVYTKNWKDLTHDYPEVTVGTSGKYQSWELPNPDRWTREYGYVCVRVDARGTGRSPGYLEIYSPRQVEDYYQCIEWAGTQGWSNGKVGLTGISYLAQNQWQVAARKPPHLAAMCPFEGSSDFFREMLYHGGIKSEFVQRWYDRQVVYNQHGLGTNGLTSPMNGELVQGPETLSAEELAKNRMDVNKYHEEHKLWDEYYAGRTQITEDIEVPVLSCGNWGGNNLHLRGNVEGYLRASSKEKYLEIHGREHYCEYYTDYGEQLQKAFFDHYLAGKGTFKDRPSVMLRIRSKDASGKEVFVDRGENEWPLARSQWTKLYLDNDNKTLSKTPICSDNVQFDAMGKGITFLLPPAEERYEMTGPMMAKLFVASSTIDADMFITLRLLDPEGKDVTFIGASDPHTFVGSGWLRASHRKLDPAKSTFYRPYHSHDEYQPLTPGKTYELEVEIWPTCVVVPKGFRFGVTISGCDCELEGDGPWPHSYEIDYRGNGPYIHADSHDRPAEVFGGKTTLFADKARPSYLLVPIIPEK